MLKVRRVVTSREKSHVWEGAWGVLPAFSTAVLLEFLLLPCMWHLEKKGGKGDDFLGSQFEWSLEADCVFKSACFSSQPWKLSSWNIRGCFLFIATLPLSPNCLRLPRHSLSCPSGSAELLLVTLPVSSRTFILLVLQVSWCQAYK